MYKLIKPLVIVANGNFPTHNIPLHQLKKSNTIIACDGAINTLINHGYKPNIIIGDLDSISTENKKKFKDVIIELIDQSENDLRKAINFVKKNNITEMSIIGASGMREDHTIGNIFSLFKYKNIKIKLFTDTGFFSCIHKNQEIQSFKGQQISIFSSDSTIKITSNNLKYNFNSSCINNLYCATLNESLSNFFKLKISHGSLVIYQTYHK